MSRQLKEYGGKIFEAKKDEAGRLKYPVVIISQGLGNLGDRNYYTAAAVESGVAVYEGKKAYYDHPTKTQAEDQPGRSVRETCGHYENCRTEKDSDGLLVLKADFIPEKNKEDVINKLDHAIEFKKKYPLKDYIGISINGDGEGSEMPYDDFIKEFNPSRIEMDKIKQIEGQPINAILKLTDAVSADLVTEAGARGRLLLESNKLNKRRFKMKFIEAMRNLLLGIEKGDQKVIEDAKSMLQAEGDDGDADDEKKKKEAADAQEAADALEADSMAKHLLAAKKELKKEDGESDDKFEARCMKQARKEWKKEKAESEKKEAAKDQDEKKEKKESKDGDADADAKKDSKDKADEKKESKEGDDDKDHADADKDKALIKKMMKQMDELKKENADLKKEKESKESEAKGHQEDAAKSKIVLMAKERAELVDRVLSESGLPRAITKEIRSVIEKCKTKEEMKETCKGLSEAFHKSVEESFYKTNQSGFTEISPKDSTGSNDSLFI